MTRFALPDRISRLTLAMVLVFLAACASVANLEWENGKAYFDRQSRVLSVKGKHYDVPETVPTALLKTGDEVRIRWEPDGDRRVVTRLQITGYQTFGRF